MGGESEGSGSRKATRVDTTMTYESDPIFVEALGAARAARITARSRMRSWVTKILDSCVVIALVLVLLVAYGLVDNRWYRIVAIEGGSMTPTIVAGDAIVLTRPPAHLEEGMVVTLEVDGVVVTHRVVSVTDDGSFTTRGDANAVADDWEGLDVDVIGIQRARIPILGRFLTSFASIRGSGAWHIDRVSVGGAAGGTACFDECPDPATEASVVETPTDGGDATVVGTTLAPEPMPSADDGMHCSDFSTRAEAQSWLDSSIASTADRLNLDPDDNGQACPNLP